MVQAMIYLDELSFRKLETKESWFFKKLQNKINDVTYIGVDENQLLRIRLSPDTCDYYGVLFTTNIRDVEFCNYLIEISNEYSRKRNVFSDKDEFMLKSDKIYLPRLFLNFKLNNQRQQDILYDSQQILSKLYGKLVH